MNDKDRVKDFWNTQAENYGHDSKATNFDLFGRELEVNTLLKYVTNGIDALDAGCGNGFVDFEIAKKKNVHIKGVDFSSELIKCANERLSGIDALLGIVDFETKDILVLDEHETYDLAFSTASLINLTSWEDQQIAINNIYQALKPGGHYIMIENTVDGLKKINFLRKLVGLKEIAIRWHNLYFDEKKLIDFLDKRFVVENVEHFSSTYYFLSRIVYPIFADTPRYDSWFNKFAKSLPSIGSMCPTVLYYLRKEK